MKETRLTKMLVTGAACAIAIGTALAQESSTTTTTGAGAGVSSTTSTSSLSGTGVISAYTPGSDYITFRGETETAAPAKYYYSKKTVLVDPEGKTVEWSSIRPDMPVNYTYVREGDRMVITKVTLQKPISTYEKTTTTTTTRP